MSYIHCPPGTRFRSADCGFQGQLDPCTTLPGGIFDPADPVFHGTGTQSSNAGACTVTIGPGASTTGEGPGQVALGCNSVGGGAGSIAAGYQATTNAVNAVAIGNAATVSGPAGVAVGVNTDSTLHSIAIGNGAQATSASGLIVLSATSTPAATAVSTAPLSLDLHPDGVTGAPAGGINGKLGVRINGTVYYIALYAS